MTDPQFIKLIACLNLLIASMLMVDHFVIPHSLHPSNVQSLPISHSVSPNSSETSFIVIDASGKKYYISENFYESLKKNDSLIVERTGLFGKAISLHQRSGPKWRTEQIGLFNKSLFGLLLLSFSGWASVAVLLFGFRMSRSVDPVKTIVALSSLSIGIAVMYFFFQ